jgi:hypothetical protein
VLYEQKKTYVTISLAYFLRNQQNANVMLKVQRCSTWWRNSLRDGSAQLQVGTAKEFAHVSSCGDGVICLRFAVLIVLLCTAGGRLAVASCVRRIS